MSEYPYDVDDPNAWSANESRPATRLRHAPDARAHDQLTYHQGADYGTADTDIEVVANCQCVHDGVSYVGGEVLRVPKPVAEFMIRSGWATAVAEPEPEPEAPPRVPARRKITAGRRAAAKR